MRWKKSVVKMGVLKGVYKWVRPSGEVEGLVGLKIDILVIKYLCDHLKKLM